MKVYLASDEFCELLFESDEGEARSLPRLEFDEHVDIAVRAEVISQDGAKKREALHGIAPAEGGDCSAVELDARTYWQSLPL